MTCGVEVPLKICQGKTFSKVYRWGQSRKVYRQISAATQAAPCIMTVTGHDLPEGWVYQVAGAKGMTELDTVRGKYRQAIVVDPNSIEINELDATNLDAYTGGGVLSYQMPVDLAGFTARMQIRRSVKSTEIIEELTTENGGIVLNNTLKTITLQLTAVETAALEEMEAVYDLEMLAVGIVTLLAYGAVIIDSEVTR